MVTWLVRVRAGRVRGYIGVHFLVPIEIKRRNIKAITLWPKELTGYPPLRTQSLLLFDRTAAGATHTGHSRVGESPAAPRFRAAARLRPTLDLIPRGGHLLRPVAPVVLEQEPREAEQRLRLLRLLDAAQYLARAWRVHGVCMVRAARGDVTPADLVCMPCTRHAHAAHTPSAPHIHHAYTMHTARTRRAHAVHAPCARHAHATRTPRHAPDQPRAWTRAAARHARTAAERRAARRRSARLQAAAASDRPPLPSLRAAARDAAAAAAQQPSPAAAAAPAISRRWGEHAGAWQMHGSGWSCWLE